MNDVYVYVQDLRQQAKVPEDGILSQTLQNDDRTRVILFGFAPGDVAIQVTVHGEAANPGHVTIK